MRMIAAFEKTDQVRHVGHLDLMRTMQRALRRSGLPIRYSQGFNPHVLLSFASPLPVGVGGREELMEIGVEEDIDASVFALRLAPAMPDSMPLLQVRAVDDRHPKLMAALVTAAYEALLPDTTASRTMADGIGSFLAQGEITALRKTKKGEAFCDIRPMLHELSQLPCENGIYLAFRVALTERETLKPSLLLSALAEHVNATPPETRIWRIRLYGEKNGAAIPLMKL